MEHFPIVQALCRAAVADGSPAAKKQIERLRDALAQNGNTKEAHSLANILTSADRLKEIAPSRLERSRATPPGEVLSRNAPLPVDRETAAPLAEVIYPADIANAAPLFNEAVNQAVSTIVEEWLHFEAMSDIDIQPSRTCLIFGAPGTGKTRLAFWIAKQMNLPVVLVKLDGLVSSFLGTTARNIGNLFTFVNRYRCILLLDEFDAIAKVRDDPQEVGEIKRVVNALLQNLDTRKDIGFTIGITNHPKLLDSAVWRRFEVQLEIPKPDFPVRLRIASHFMAPVAAPASHLKLIAWFTKDATGAEVESLVRAYKKASATPHSDKKLEVLESLRRFATLNSARVHPERRALLFGEIGALLGALKDDATLDFSLTDLGELSGKDRSTVSRLLSRKNRSTRDEGP
jgi:SpoVK/Ycf46/Vps4 family AAA+-type ATPase